MKSSSNTNGSARAKAKGHPTMAPVAKIRVEARVRRLFCELFGVNAYAKARVDVYMANEDGRKADEEDQPSYNVDTAQRATNM